MNYQIGTGDPVIHPDKGAGAWGSESKTLASEAEKVLILEALPAAYGLIGQDAVANLLHYFTNSGTPQKIRLANMINDVPSARTLFNVELSNARVFAETLKPGVWHITSNRASGGYDTETESKNWFFAVGGYSAWGKGVVSIPPLGKTRHFKMTFEYKFYDRYNWDTGKSVTIGGVKITDHFMGSFHRQGLAKEYDSVGSHVVAVQWTPGSAPIVTPMSSGGRT